MTRNAFQIRAKVLEDSFFLQRDTQLMQNLKTQLEQEQQRAALCQECGIRDEATLDHLLAIGIRPETIPALMLAPLVLVAWSDRLMEQAEREAILQAAREEGLEEGTICWNLLRQWLQEAPPTEVLKQAWMNYVGTVYKQMSAAAQQTLRDESLGRARRVAKAAGGILGIASISSSEWAMLGELESAFHV
jgi:hypothetical protein